MLDTVEYFWDEQFEIGHYTVENTYTGELKQRSVSQPFNWPPKLTSYEAFQNKYFAELVTYLKTQDPYGDVCPS